MNKKPYDLEERTAQFGEDVIALCRKIKPNNIVNPLINQIVRSGTSIGANYMEANGASSKKDFTNKIFICKKECQETKHWLRMLAACKIEATEDEIRRLWKEAQELNLIFQKIASSSRKST
ncbi:MAG: four helix bundle protein [Candidatus Liptonbacteria bacterium]|nr:four helix bundle protein [Candidatus Liptonbacteria bacterium]